MIKVHISTCCPHCHGKAYLEAGVAKGDNGEQKSRYFKCYHCQGSGELAIWVNMKDFLGLLENIKAGNSKELDEAGS